MYCILYMILKQIMNCKQYSSVAVLKLGFKHSRSNEGKKKPAIHLYIVVHAEISKCIYIYHFGICFTVYMCITFLSKIFSHKGHIYGKCGHCLAGNYMGQVDPEMLIFVVGSLRLILAFSQRALFWIPVMRSGCIFVNSYWGTLIVELKVWGVNRLSVLVSLWFQQ